MGVRTGLFVHTCVAPTLSTYGDVAGKLGAYPQALTGSAVPPTGSAVGPLSPDAVTTVDPARGHTIAVNNKLTTSSVSAGGGWVGYPTNAPCAASLRASVSKASISPAVK